MSGKSNELRGYAFKEDGSCFADETVKVPSDINTRESIMEWVKNTGHFRYNGCIVFIPMNESWIKDGSPVMIPLLKEK